MCVCVCAPAPSHPPHFCVLFIIDCTSVVTSFSHWPCSSVFFDRWLRPFLPEKTALLPVLPPWGPLGGGYLAHSTPTFA